jgi:hypothetical protein
MANLEMRSMYAHHPREDDQVLAWLRDRRDAYPAGAWVYRRLIDEYVEAARIGMSLEEVVNGREDVPRGARKKKKS